METIHRPPTYIIICAQAYIGRHYTHSICMWLVGQASLKPVCLNMNKPTIETITLPHLNLKVYVLLPNLVLGPTILCIKCDIHSSLQNLRLS